MKHKATACSWVMHIQTAVLAGLLATALLLGACAEEPQQAGAPEGSGPAGAAALESGAAGPCPFVVVGDSLAATQNSSMLETQSVHLYPELIAGQAGWPMPFARISYPGFPAALELKSLDPPVVGQITDDPAAFGTRTNIGATICNVSVPGARAIDALAALTPAQYQFLEPYPYHVPAYLPVFVINHLYVLGLSGTPYVPKSQVGYAEALQPQTILLWLGANDVLWAPIQGSAAFITPQPVFEAAYSEAIGRLAATGAQLVVGNIPDVTSIAYVTPADDYLWGIASNPATPPFFTFELLAAATGLRSTDSVTPDAVPYVPALLACVGAALADPAIPVAGACPLPPDLVFSAEEAAQTQAAADAFNAFIAAKAAEHGALLVDMRAVLAHADTYGLVVGGHRITTGFLGGVFSFDGIHPGNTGHAVIANAFIKAMNSRLGMAIPPLSVEQAYQDDPYIFDWTGRPPSALDAMTEGAVRSINGSWHR